MRARGLTTMLASTLGIAAALVAIPGVAAAGVQEGSGGSTGYVEICKTFTAGPAGSPVYQGTFGYNISIGRFSTNVALSAMQDGPQACTAPISVPAGTLTVSEVQRPWFSVTGISATQGDPGTVTPSPSSPGVASVTVNPAPSPGNKSLTTTVRYTNAPTTGVVEVCKRGDANSPSLTGTYGFTVTSEASDINVQANGSGPYDQPWSTTASATISAGGLGCSGPITVPAGAIQTVETGTTYVTGITAVSNSRNQLIGTPSLTTGTSSEYVRAGTTTGQTVVTYTDALATVKLCKRWVSDEAPPSTPFPFTTTSSGPAGPTTVTPSLGLSAGECQIVGTVRAGTRVNVEEGVIPGTKVAAISVNPTANSQGNSPVVPGSLSLPNRTVSIIAGAGETDITYVDQDARPGTLKICVDPSGSPSAGTAHFTVNGSQGIDVNLDPNNRQCTIDPTPLTFDAPVTISGGGLVAPTGFSGSPVAAPANVEVLECGVPTDTNQLSLTASSASTATVLMSEGVVTEITFTVDPTADVPAPVDPAPPVGSGSGGASTPPVASQTPSGPVSSGAPASVSVAASGAALPALAGVVPMSQSITPSNAERDAQVAVVHHRLALVHHRLAKIRASIRRLSRALASHHLSKKLRRADKRARRIDAKKQAALLILERRLINQLS